MTRAERNLFNALKAIGAPVIERPEGDGDGPFVLSAEDNYERVWADVYQPDHGEFGVDQEVCDIVRSHGFMLEWINAGMLGVYPNV